MRGKSFRLLLLLVTMLLALGLAGCGGDDEPEAEETTTGTAETTETEPEETLAGGTLVFGGAADPVLLDAALVSDGETLRVIDQIFEGLVGLKPGTTELEPSLATSWEISPDGLEYTFELQQDVVFHDGEPFNADAVCFNYDRWYNFEGALANPSASYYWQTVFGGFATYDPDSGAPEESYYDSCEAVDDDTVIIRLTKPSSAILGAMALASFSIASPKALVDYDADSGTVDADGVFQSGGTFGTEHPIGTGPFKFESWTPGESLTLVRNEDYWGEKAQLDSLIFRPIPDNAARLQALQTGEIQGYDLVEPQDMETLAGEGYQVLDRPPFNVGYVGINQANPPFDDIKVRQAIAHGLNRQEVVDSFYAGRGEVAHQFMPPSLIGYAPSVTEYEYDPEKSKALLQEAGLTLPVPLEFWYPSDVSRPYMPDPKRNFEAFAASLNESGFKVTAKTAPWSPDYLGRVNEGTAGNLFLLGWTGDFGDPDNFVGTFFQTEQPQWGFNNPELFDLLNRAETETDLDARIALYEEANVMIADFIPGVPYVHTSPALAFAPGVSGYVPSPVSLESFAPVTIQE